MRTDDEAHGQRVAAGGIRFIDGAQIARRVEVDAGLGPPTQHEPANSDIGPAGFRVDDEIG